MTGNSKRIDVRPTLVVGVGGTGCLVARRYNALVGSLLPENAPPPPFIKCLGFDTDAQEEGDIPRLPREDFFNLLHNLEIGTVIRDYFKKRGSHEHLKFLEEMKLDSGAAGFGCQGLNRIGRVVFFEQRERIQRAVSARMRALNSTDDIIRAMGPYNERYNVELGGRPAIHIVASVCGGTGAGMLLDLSYNLLKWGEREFRRRPDIIGHLVLPEAIPVASDRIRDKLRAVGLATLQQIELLSDQHRMAFEVEYRDHSTVHIDKRSAPFDLLYLLGGTAPGHGARRNQLTELISRMIGAMSVEPASHQIFSDANNKQVDVLSSRDETTWRRRFCSSYGLRYGVTQTMQSEDEAFAKIERWIREDLRDFTNVDLGRHIELPGETLFAQMGDTQQWTSSIGSIGEMRYDEGDLTASERDRLKQRIQDKLKAHLANQEEVLRQRIDTDIPKEIVGNVLNTMLSSVNEVLRGQTNDVAQQVYSVIASWHESAKRATKRLGHHVSGQYRSVCNNITSNLINQLTQEALREYDNESDGYLSLDIEAIRKILRGVTSYSNALAEPLVREAILTAFKQVESELDKMVFGLKRLAQAARASRTAYVDKSQTDDHFAMPLFQLQHPAKRLESQQPDSSLEHRDYTDKFILPLLRSFSVDLAGQPPVTADAAANRYKAVLESRRKEMRDFISDAIIRQQEMIFEPLDGRQAMQHELYEPLLQIDEQTAVQVAMNQQRRFEDTLDVVVVQHPAGSDLGNLIDSTNRDHRAATIPSSEDVKIPFQLHKFAYGFCLPALDGYEEYEAAMKRHLRRSDLDEIDFWLDPLWHREYHERLPSRWQSERDQKVLTPLEFASEEDPDKLKESFQDTCGAFFKSLQNEIEPVIDAPGSGAIVRDLNKTERRVENWIRESDLGRLVGDYNFAMGEARSCTLQIADWKPELSDSLETHYVDLETEVKRIVNKPR